MISSKRDVPYFKLMITEYIHSNASPFSETASSEWVFYSKADNNQVSNDVNDLVKKVLFPFNRNLSSTCIMRLIDMVVRLDEHISP